MARRSLGDGPRLAGEWGAVLALVVPEKKGLLALIH